LMIDDWWLMIDDWWLMIDDWWLMIDDWWLMIDDWWLMIDDWWLILGSKREDADEGWYDWQEHEHRQNLPWNCLISAIR